VSNEKILLFRFVYKDRCWQLMLHAEDEKFHKLRTNINAKELLSISKSLVQISPDYIVNLNHLAYIENKTMVCSFYPPHDDINLTVSKRHLAKIKERLEII